jgi:hypothetical protein
LNWAFQVLLIGAAWTRERLPEDAPQGPKPEEVVPTGRIQPAVPPGSTASG